MCITLCVLVYVCGERERERERENAKKRQEVEWAMKGGTFEPNCYVNKSSLCRGIKCYGRRKIQNHIQGVVLKIRSLQIPDENDSLSSVMLKTPL